MPLSARGDGGFEYTGHGPAGASEPESAPESLAPGFLDQAAAFEHAIEDRLREVRVMQHETPRGQSPVGCEQNLGGSGG